MKAIDRLRALESGEKAPDHELPKLTKGGFGGFVSEGVAPRADIFGGSAHYRWQILEPDGRHREVCCLPARTRSELEACYSPARLFSLPDSAAEAGALIHQQGR